MRAKEEAAVRQRGEEPATETAATPAPSTAKDATAGRGPAEVTAAEVAGTTMELDESDDDDAGCDALPDLDAATDSDDGVGLDSSGDNAKPGAHVAAKGGSGGRGSGARPGAGPIVLDAETDEDDDDGVGLAQSRHVARSSGATGGTKRAVVWDDDDDDDAPNVACSNAVASAPVPTLAMDSDEADELEEEILEDMSDLDD